MQHEEVEPASFRCLLCAPIDLSRGVVTPSPSREHSLSIIARAEASADAADSHHHTIRLEGRDLTCGEKEEIREYLRDGVP